MANYLWQIICDKLFVINNLIDSLDSTTMKIATISSQILQDIMRVFYFLDDVQTRDWSNWNCEILFFTSSKIASLKKNMDLKWIYKQLYATRDIKHLSVYFSKFSPAFNDKKKSNGKWRKIDFKVEKTTNGRKF